MRRGVSVKLRKKKDIEAVGAYIDRFVKKREEEERREKEERKRKEREVEREK